MTAVALSIPCSGLADVRQHAPGDVTHSQRPISPILHNASPSSRPQHGGDEDMRRVEQNPRVLREKIRIALSRRIGPGTGLTVKMVANATGLTDRTVENAMSGNNTPRGETLHALLDFFDATFANEIFAGSTFMVVKLADHRAAAAARMINEGAAVLAALRRGE